MKLRDIKIGVLVFWICLLLIFCRAMPVNSLEWKLKEGDELSWKVEKLQIEQERPAMLSIFPSFPISTSIREGDIFTIQIISLFAGTDHSWDAEFNYTVGDQERNLSIRRGGLSLDIIFPVYERSSYEDEVSQINANSNFLEASLTDDVLKMTYENAFQSVKATTEYNIAKGYQIYYYLKDSSDAIEYKIVENSDLLLSLKILSALLGIIGALLLGVVTGVIIQPLIDKPKSKANAK